MEDYFFLALDCLAAVAACFFTTAVLALVCFCVVFFWLDFGDLSPIMLAFYCGLTHLRNVSFSEGKAIMLGERVLVNDGCELISRKLPPPQKIKIRAVQN